MSKRRSPSDEDSGRTESSGDPTSPPGAGGRSQAGSDLAGSPGHRTGAESGAESGAEGLSVANFEEHLARLEQIVADLETGTLGLEEALGRFEAGVGLLRQCQATLTAAERQIELLTGIQPDGTPRTEPFPDQA
ncbi:MAG: exodeoxyribonuclease VII small subunit [Planctomycetaceae bacterium]